MKQSHTAMGCLQAGRDSLSKKTEGYFSSDMSRMQLEARFSESHDTCLKCAQHLRILMFADLNWNIRCPMPRSWRTFPQHSAMHCTSSNPSPLTSQLFVYHVHGQSLRGVDAKRAWEYSAFRNFFPKLCLILEEWFLTRFPPNFQERFLMSSASPEFVFWGPKIKQVLF